MNIYVKICKNNYFTPMMGHGACCEGLCGEVLYGLAFLQKAQELHKPVTNPYGFSR